MSTPWRVLAVDDSLTIRKLLEMALGRSGYHLELASSGEEGIGRARRHPPHLILLDYVLPDMKGLDVCTALSQDERTRAVPIVVMSAKSDDLRPVFRDFDSVVEFVSKPFTAPEISFRVSDILGKLRGGPNRDAAAASAESPEAFSFAVREAAAKAMFTHLRGRFAHIPEWAGAMGEAAPAPYFARKILTPELMESLLGSLAPVLGVGRGPASDSEPPLLQGQTSLLPLTNLLKELNACGRTGVLQLEQERGTTWLHLRRGEMVFATHNRPDDYLRQAWVDVGHIPPAEVERARAEQRKSGRPLHVSLAEAGHLRTGDLPDLLYQQGKRILLEAIAAGPCPFEWLEQALPVYVDAYARPYRLEQLGLERLREVDDWAQVELHVGSLDLIFRRAAGFSQKLQLFELTENERRVLTLVDNRNTVRHIIERSALATFEVFHVLFRMSEVGLIHRDDPPAAAAGSARDARPVMLLDPDAAGVEEPLGRFLRRRRHPIPLLSLSGEKDLKAAFIRERPRMVILNAGAPGLDPARTAREVRATLEISDIALVAVLDEDQPALVEELQAAGFDAVLVKPFLFGDVERLLAA